MTSFLKVIFNQESRLTQQQSIEVFVKAGPSQILQRQTVKKLKEDLGEFSI